MRDQEHLSRSYKMRFSAGVLVGNEVFKIKDTLLNKHGTLTHCLLDYKVF